MSDENPGPKTKMQIVTEFIENIKSGKTFTTNAAAKVANLSPCSTAGLIKQSNDVEKAGRGTWRKK